MTDNPSSFAPSHLIVLSLIFPFLSNHIEQDFLKKIDFLLRKGSIRMLKLYYLSIIACFPKESNILGTVSWISDTSTRLTLKMFAVGLHQFFLIQESLIYGSVGL